MVQAVQQKMDEDPSALQEGLCQAYWKHTHTKTSLSFPNQKKKKGCIVNWAFISQNAPGTRKKLHKAEGAFGDESFSTS